MADNNIWNYDDGMSQSHISLQFVETIAGVDQFRMFDTGVAETVPIFINKQGATYTQSSTAANIPLTDGFWMQVGSFSIILLRDDLAVGDSWTETPEWTVTVQGNGLSQDVPASLTYTGTIMERGATEAIGPLIFNDVIKSTITVTQIINGQATHIDAEYWFAKDVGIIKMVTTTSLDNATSTRYLINYDLN